MSELSNSKRLAKNTLLMYVRMIFLMVVSLYTSRVVLQQLGVEDFGIYNLVGSLVAMFISLKSILAVSTQRFLNVEMGKGNHEKLQLIYNLSTYINVIIAILFILIVEAVGFWFLECKANIPSDRIYAAHWVLQFSIATTAISIMNTPFDACVIAHERMDFYAYLSIFEGLAKLGICYLLTSDVVDKLVLYAALTLLVSIIIRCANHYFCYTRFQECRIVRVWDSEYFKKMLSYASWAFFGNTAYMFAQSGLNMVLNVFGGPVVNAARGIAYQVNSALGSFISNIGIVLKPYAIKSYAQGDRQKAFSIAFLSSKIYFFIQLMLAVFVGYLADYLIGFWLGQIPDYVVVFLDLVLLHSVVKSFHMPLDMLFSAEGNIKYYQLFEGIVLFMPVPASYFLLDAGLPYYTAFLSVIFFEIVHILGIAVIGKQVFALQLLPYFTKVIFPCLLCTLLCLWIYFMVCGYLDTFVNHLVAMGITMCVVTLCMVGIILENPERKLLLSLIISKK